MRLRKVVSRKSFLLMKISMIDWLLHLKRIIKFNIKYKFLKNKSFLYFDWKIRNCVILINQEIVLGYFLRSLRFDFYFLNLF